MFQKLFLFIFIVFAFTHSGAVIYSVVTPWWGGGEMSSGEALTYSPWWRCSRGPAMGNYTDAWVCQQLDADAYSNTNVGDCTRTAKEQRHRLYAIRGVVIATGSLSTVSALLGMAFFFTRTQGPTSFSIVGPWSACSLLLLTFATLAFAATSMGLSISTFKDYLFCNTNVCDYLSSLYEGTCEVTFYNSAYVFYVTTVLPLINFFIAIFLLCASCGVCLSDGAKRRARNARRAQKEAEASGAEYAMQQRRKRSTNNTNSDDDYSDTEVVQKSRANNDNNNTGSRYPGNNSANNRSPSQQQQQYNHQQQQQQQQYSSSHQIPQLLQQTQTPQQQQYSRASSVGRANYQDPSVNNDATMMGVNNMNNASNSNINNNMRMSPSRAASPSVINGATAQQSTPQQRGGGGGGMPSSPIPPTARFNNSNVNRSDVMMTPQQQQQQGGGYGALVVARRSGSIGTTPHAHPPEGYEPPAGGDWVWDLENHMFWSQNEFLFLNPKDGHFFDPDSQHWYNPDTETWYPANPST